MIRCSHEHDCGFGGRMIFILNGQLVVVNLELVNLSLVGSFSLIYASWWLYFCFGQMGPKPGKAGGAGRAHEDGRGRQV